MSWPKAFAHAVEVSAAWASDNECDHPWHSNPALIFPCPACGADEDDDMTDYKQPSVLRDVPSTASAHDDAITEVRAEMARAIEKFPTWPTDPLHALAVLGEEYGELTQAMLQLTYEPHKTSKSDVRAEAIQTAAMALRLIVSLDEYEYRQGPQHQQGADDETG